MTYTAMKSQKEIWQNEHIRQETFTRMHSDRPSGPIPGFVAFLEERGCTPELTRILDIGCGKGRNSIWLASKGFDVVGVDFTSEAIEEASRRNSGRFKNLKFAVADLIDEWPYPDDYYQAIIDCNTTICIPNPGRARALAEAYRVLRPGGYYLFYGIGPTALTTKSPGPEPNSAIFPKTGKFEKQYSKEELLSTYNDYKVVRLDEQTGSDLIEGKEIVYSMWVGIFQALHPSGVGGSKLER